MEKIPWKFVPLKQSRGHRGIKTPPYPLRRLQSSRGHVIITQSRTRWLLFLREAQSTTGFKGDRHDNFLIWKSRKVTALDLEEWEPF